MYKNIAYAATTSQTPILRFMIGDTVAEFVRTDKSSVYRQVQLCQRLAYYVGAYFFQRRGELI